MKRRCLLLASVALVVVMALLVPGAALADDGAKGNKVEFVASGLVYIGPYESESKGPVEFVRNEPVDSLLPLSSSSWDDVDGGWLTSLHDGSIVIKPDGTFKGHLRGTFIVYAEDGSQLTGKMTGKVSGFGSLETPGTYIQDSGRWRSTKGSTGAFEGVDAKGTWSVYMEPMEVAPGVWTYVGLLTLEGSYKAK